MAEQPARMLEPTRCTVEWQRSGSGATDAKSSLDGTYAINGAPSLTQWFPNPFFNPIHFWIPTSRAYFVLFNGSGALHTKILDKYSKETENRAEVL